MNLPMQLIARAANNLRLHSAITFFVFIFLSHYLHSIEREIIY